MEKLLEVKDLTIQYDNKNYAVKNIDMDINYKEIISIVGESGSGKTTLVRSIINLLSPGAKIISGEMIFCGKNIQKYHKEQWRKLRGNEISMIFQNPGSYLNPIRKIGKQFIENIRSHRDTSKIQAVKKANNILGKMGFDDGDRIMNSYPYQLSGGMKQRVAIAMAIAMEPKLILADEPTSALDVITQTQIANELMDLRNTFDTSIVIVTHNIGFAAYMADRIMIMHDGEVVEYDNKSKVILEPKSLYTKGLLQTIPELKGW
ncbi:ABC transporter ATP-binding protein [Clostridium sp. D2Q-14]|uniref:ABC transporter ATP-binding protein n=1 Tax=Anaeromonas gelatinilytica TaxID=2683194 RepID=UPI00193C59C5|nr:ABC transporter ATP-binding protein [Anaeromonas gelatinilytica]MBS4536522.1 ABC transporter ATP-binding protein [Anaeromonas gelatinilytica]